MFDLLKTTKVQILIIALVTFLAYSNIFQNQFIGDDEIFILDWQLPKELSNWPKMFTIESVPEGHEEGGYRPLRAVFFAIAYQLWKIDPWGYHLDSIIIHLINTLLVYFIARELVSSIKYQVSSKKPLILNTYYLIPFIVALLFGLHPIHTEAVTQIIASFDTLGIGFMLGSFLLYLKAQYRFPQFSRIYFVAVTLGWIAFFYYEMTLTLPLLLLLYDFCFQKKRLFKKPISYMLKFYGPFLLGVALFLFIRVGLFHLISRGGYIDNSFYLTMLLMSRVFVIYTKLLLWPVDLSLNHTIAPGVQVWLDSFTNMDFIRSQSILHTDILFNIGVLLSFIFLFFKLLKKAPLASFGIGWYLIGFLPASYIIPTGALLQERYIYLASFGFVLVMGYGLMLIQSSCLAGRQVKFKVQNTILLTSAFLLFTFYFYQTYQRNKDWKDPITFYEKLVSQIPNHIVSNYTLASLYDENKDYRNAIRYYEKALHLEQNIPNIYYLLGRDYLKIGDKKKAQENFLKVLKFYPNHIGAKVFLVQGEDTPSVSSRELHKDGWKPYILHDNYLFFYPNDWEVREDQDEVVVSSENSDFKIMFKVFAKDLNIIDEKNIEKFENTGLLLLQSVIKLPNFKNAYIRLWQQQNLQKLEFFIIEPREIIGILIFPYNQKDYEKEFNEIMSLLQRV